MTKTTILAAALIGALTLPTFAGGMADPVMSADVVMDQTTAPSSNTTMLPAILFALLVAAATAGS